MLKRCENLNKPRASLLKSYASGLRDKQDMVFPITHALQSVSRKLGNPSLYCDFMLFNNKSPNQKKRQAIRQKLVWRLQQYSNSPVTQQIGDMLVRPGTSLKNPIASVSISHCPMIGGSVFSLNKNISIGFDIEIVHRLSLKTICRVSQAQELAYLPSSAGTPTKPLSLLTPALKKSLISYGNNRASLPPQKQPDPFLSTLDYALLWTAKEASLKTLGPSCKNRPFLLSQCCISHWRVCEFFYRFCFTVTGHNIKGIGGAFRLGELAISYAHKTA